MMSISHDVDFINKQTDVLIAQTVGDIRRIS